MVWLGGFDQEGSIHIHSGFVDPASFCKASVSGPWPKANVNVDFRTWCLYVSPYVHMHQMLYIGFKLHGISHDLSKV